MDSDTKLSTETSVTELMILNITESPPFLPNQTSKIMLACQIYGFIVGVLGFIGIPTNMLAFLVFCKARDRTSTNFLLQVLAVADSLFLFWSMFIWTGFAFNVTSEEGIIYYFDTFEYALPFIKGIGEFSRDFAVWMVVLVSLDRFTAIYFPLNSTTANRIPKVKVATVVLLIGSLGINIPRFLHIKYDGSRSLRMSDFSYGVVYFSVDAIVIHFLPIIFVVLFNAMIIRALKVASRRRLVVSRCDNEKESCTTWTLVAIATIFVVCELPKVVHVIMEIYIYVQYDEQNRTFGDQTAMIVLIYTLVANTFQLINSFVNFFIYCLIAKRFRNSLSRLIRNAKLSAKSWMFGNPKSATETYEL